MKVMNFIEEGKFGGPQVRIVRVAAALKGKVETIVVMPRANSDAFQKFCLRHAIPFKTLFLTRITKKVSAALAFILFSPFEIVYIAWLFRRNSIDLVHVSGGSWQFKAVIAARLARVPSVWHLNDTLMPYWVRLLFRHVQPFASGFIFASNRSRSYYRDLIPKGRPEAVVSSTVDLLHFKPDDRCSYRNFDDIDDGPVIGTVANVSPVKGLEVLIQSASFLMENYPRLRVIVAGSVFSRQKKYYSRLVRLANELGVIVEWVGTCHDIRSFLKGLDVYVCSSVAESSPSSVWEAMAMAKPIVSTDVGDVPRHVSNGVSGFIVSVGDAKAMAGRIKQLLDDHELRSRLGRLARIESSTFSPDVVASKTLNIYKNILA